MLAKTDAGWTGPGLKETIALMAALMGMTALGIDTILPALPDIGQSYAITDANSLQIVIYVYMAAFAVAQLIYGPLADVFGRRPVLLTGLVIMTLGAVYSALAPSFDHLIAGRILQAVGAASARVIALSIVRDRFHGRDMARVMSFIMMIFIMVPVLAPNFGGLVLLAANWRWIFGAMFVLALITSSWFGLRMPETLHPEYRRPLSVASIVDAARICVGNRAAVGYATALGMMFGGLMSFLGSSEQILGSDVYRLGTLFPVAFACLALAIGLGSFANSALVRRFGMRRLSHGAQIAYFLTATTLFVWSILDDGIPPFFAFMLLMGLGNFFFSVVMANYNALALESLGAVAGTASSLIGAYTTLLGTVIGATLGLSFDGTVLPVVFGLSLLSTLSIIVLLWTERGRLFQPHNDGPVAVGADVH